MASNPKTIGCKQCHDLETRLTLMDDIDSKLKASESQVTEALRLRDDAIRERNLTLSQKTSIEYEFEMFREKAKTREADLSDCLEQFRQNEANPVNVVDLQRQIQQLSDDLSATKAELERQKEVEATKMAEIQQLSKGLSAANEELERVKIEHVTEMERLKTELCAAKGLELNLSAKMTEIQQLQESLSRSQSDYAVLEEEQSDLKEKIKSILEEVSTEKTAEMKSHEALLRCFRNIQRIVRGKEDSRLDDLITEEINNKSGELMEELKSKVQSLEKEIETLRVQQVDENVLTEKQDEVEALRNEMEAIRSDKVRLQAEYDKLSAQLSESVQECNDMKSALNELLEQITNEKREANDLRRAKEAEVETLKERVNDLSEQRTNLENERRTLEEELKRKLDESRVQLEDNADYKQVTESLSREVEALLESKTKVLGVFTEKKAELEAELGALKAFYEVEKTAMAKELTEGIAKFTNFSTKMGAEVANLHDEKRQLVGKLASETTLQDALREEMDELKSELQKLLPIVQEKQVLERSFNEALQDRQTLQSLIDEKEACIDEKDQELDEIRAKAASLEHDLAALQTLHKQQETQMSERITELETLQSRLEETKASLKSLADQKDASAGEKELELIENRTKIAELRQQLDAKTTLTSELADLKQKLDVIEEECQEKNLRIAELEEVETRLVEKLEKIKRTFADEKASIIAQFEDKLKDAETLQTSFDAKIGHLTGQMRELQESLQDKEEKLDSIQMVKDDLDADVRKFKEQSEAKEAEIERLSQQADDQLKTINDLNARLAAEIATKDEVLQRIKTLEDSSLASMDQQTQKQNATIDHLRLELAAATEKVESLTYDLTIEDEKLKSVKEIHGVETNDLSAKIQQLQAQIETDLVETSRLKRTLADKEREIAARTEEARVFAERLQNAERVFSDQRLSVERDAGEQISVLQSRVVDLEGELKRLSGELAAKLDALTVLEQEKVDLTTDLAEKSKVVESLTTQMGGANVEFSRQMAALGEEKTGLQQELKSFRDKYFAQRDQQVPSLNTKIAALIEEKARLEGRAVAAEKRVAAMDEELRRLREEDDQLKQQLQQKHRSQAETQTKMIEMDDMIEQQRNTIEELQRRLKETSNLMARHKEEAATATKTAQELRETLGDVRAELRRNVIEMTRTRDDSDLLSAQLEEQQKMHIFKTNLLKEEIEELKKKSAGLQDELMSVTEQYKALRLERQTRKSLGPVDERIQELNIRLKQALKENEELNLELIDLKRQLAGHNELKSKHQTLRLELDEIRKSQNQERKNRRQSAHDELRPGIHSTKTLHVQTDPADANCRCVELNEKLIDVQRSLKIAEIRLKSADVVTNSKMAPLRKEIYDLKKTIKLADEETCKVRAEKQALLARLQSVRCAACEQRGRQPLASIQVQTDPEPRPILAPAPDKELSNELVIIRRKYEDLKKLARYRNERIRDLESSLKTEKENVSANSSGTSIAVRANEELTTLRRAYRELEEKYNELRRGVQYPKARQSTEAQTDLE